MERGIEHGLEVTDASNLAWAFGQGRTLREPIMAETSVSRAGFRHDWVVDREP